MSDTDKAIISESYINILQHRIAELEAKLHWYETAFNPPLVKPPKNLVKESAP